MDTETLLVDMFIVNMTPIVQLINGIEIIFIETRSDNRNNKAWLSLLLIGG